MFTQEFSLDVWLRVRPENDPKKIGQCRYFWVFRTDQKEIRSSATPPPPPLNLIHFVHEIARRNDAVTTDNAFLL